MVLEQLVSVREAWRRPWLMFLVGGVVSVLCLSISSIVFPTFTGIATVFLVTFAMTPFMVRLAQHEEFEEERLATRHKLRIFQRYRHLILIYTAFFAGMVISLSILFTILPEDYAEKIFNDQLQQIKILRGRFTLPTFFQTIFFNNLGVLLLAFLFSLLFGAGAVFIISWNASVLAAAIGMMAKSLGGVAAIPVAVLVFLPHGSLELLAYFIGGIAGGIISAAIARRKSKFFGEIMLDSLTWLGIAVLLVFAGALIEAMLI